MTCEACNGTGIIKPSGSIAFEPCPDCQPQFRKMKKTITGLFVIAAFFAFCQKVNKKPSLFSITTVENIPRMTIVGDYYEYVIYRGDNALKIDADGVFHSGNDTLANSCELLDWFEYSIKLALTRTTLEDSVYAYRREVLFYRQWFKDNSTPNPLTPKSEFKYN